MALDPSKPLRPGDLDRHVSLLVDREELEAIDACVSLCPEQEVRERLLELTGDALRRLAWSEANPWSKRSLEPELEPPAVPPSGKTAEEMGL